MSNYGILVNILDKIREEAPKNLSVYHPDPLDLELINQARAKAYIHLFLKASVGILDFNEREKYITDSTNDGGIDGYFVDEKNKSIFFIQSKFRANESNFRKKEILLEEILKMDIERILQGEITYEDGVSYNGKILGMQRRLKNIPDIARYRYEVIILANLTSIAESKIRILTSGIPARIYNYEKTFSDLVFPVVTGSFYNYSDLCINVNLSNKSSGAHINYSVETSQGNCDITVLFISLIEIGQLMYNYKNSILKYNPRSYLTLNEGSINSEIKDTVLDNDTNEFALFNNGITILSDETFFNHKIGQKDKAQLSIKNPQIINGGQTAYTLSLLYDESFANNIISDKLQRKEVLVKIITFSLENSINIKNKIELIEEISEATNKQNLVNNADRNSNNPLLIASQQKLFLEFGLLLERKRGEFFDGLRYGYIEKHQIIDRGIFMKIAFSTLGYPVPPKKEKQLLTEEKIIVVLNNAKNFKKYYFGCLLYSELQKDPNKGQISQELFSAYYSIIAISTFKHYQENLNDDELKNIAREAIKEISSNWSLFENYVATKFHNTNYFNYNFNFYNKSYKLTIKYSEYYRSSNLAVDLNDFFFSGKQVLAESKNARKGLMTLNNFLKRKFLDIEMIERIKPFLNTNDIFDDLFCQNISNNLNIDIRSVRTAIKLITSKDYGYFLSDNNDNLNYS